MRILSGIQPTGLPHLGNYFGMMKPAIELQEKGEALYFIADLHALTTVRDPEALRRNSREVATDFLACGLDPAKACLFRQSDIACIPELSWILSPAPPPGPPRPGGGPGVRPWFGGKGFRFCCAACTRPRRMGRMRGGLNSVMPVRTASCSTRPGPRWTPARWCRTKSS